jgi:hypothetical protein
MMPNKKKSTNPIVKDAFYFARQFIGRCGRCTSQCSCKIHCSFLKTTHAQLSAQEKSSNRTTYSPTLQKNNNHSKSISPAGILKQKIVSTNLDQELDTLGLCNKKFPVQSSLKRDKQDTVLPEKKIVNHLSDLRGQAGRNPNDIGPDGTVSSAKTTAGKENHPFIVYKDCGDDEQALLGDDAVSKNKDKAELPDLNTFHHFQLMYMTSGNFNPISGQDIA